SFLDAFSNSLRFAMVSFDKVEFICNELQFTSFSDCHFKEVNFKDGSWFSGILESGDHNCVFTASLNFIKMDLQAVVFVDLDFKNSLIENCNLQISFIKCYLSSLKLKNNRSEMKSSIDFWTLRNSSNIDEITLKEIFGIRTPYIRDVINKITVDQQKITIFISYSFKDEKFAEHLNGQLHLKNIKTFFLEK
ncbi:MAG: hypothetical protein ABUL44_02850, partial [Flavobacterium sp.]